MKFFIFISAIFLAFSSYADPSQDKVYDDQTTYTLLNEILKACPTQVIKVLSQKDARLASGRIVHSDLGNGEVEYRRYLYIDAEEVDGQHMRHYKIIASNIAFKTKISCVISVDL